MLRQISVFVDNRPGRITEVTRILAAHSINIRALVIADRGRFGMLKIMVDNVDAAIQFLTDAGFACALKSLLAVKIADTPGGLHALTRLLAEESINIADAYGFVLEAGKQAVFCLEVDDWLHAQDVVACKGFSIVDSTDMYA